jgi:CRP/FNR family transcriptional regulator, cyclic AMP receptor protein
MTESSPAEILALLREHQFFHGLDEKFLARLSEKAYERSYDAGVLLVREGDTAEEFFALLSGKLALEIVVPGRQRMTVQTLGPGEVLGWSWLFPPHRWRLDARTVKPSRAIGFSARFLRALLDERPKDGYAFLIRLLPVIATRLENSRIQLLDLHRT